MASAWAGAAPAWVVEVWAAVVSALGLAEALVAAGLAAQVSVRVLGVEGLAWAAEVSVVGGLAAGAWAAGVSAAPVSGALAWEVEGSEPVSAEGAPA